MHSTIQVEQELQCVDLGSVPLRKLGVTRKQLIDTEKDQYPATRKWAEAIHRQCPQAQGLSWVSRQDDSARAVVLFADLLGRDLCAVGSVRHSTQRHQEGHPVNIDPIANAIELDAGEAVPGLRESLAEMRDGIAARTTTPEHKRGLVGARQSLVPHPLRGYDRL